MQEYVLTKKISKKYFIALWNFLHPKNLQVMDNFRWTNLQMDNCHPVTVGECLKGTCFLSTKCDDDYSGGVFLSVTKKSHSELPGDFKIETNYDGTGGDVDAKQFVW